MAPNETRLGESGVARGGCTPECSRLGRASRVTIPTHSIFLLLPRGAGSICGKLGAFLSTGVLLYVTVRVTTSRTLTRLDLPVLASASHTLGDAVGNGEMAELVAESELFGDRTAAGEKGD